MEFRLRHIGKPDTARRDNREVVAIEDNTILAKLGESVNFLAAIQPVSGRRNINNTLLRVCFPR